MAASFQAKDSEVLEQQLEIQSLAIRANSGFISADGDDLLVEINEPIDSILMAIKQIPAGTVSGVEVSIEAPSQIRLVNQNTLVSFAPDLKSAASFGLLAGTSIVSANTSTVDGNIGVAPGATITGFPPGTKTGSSHANDATAIQAQVDLAAAYASIVSRGFNQDLSGTPLDGLTLDPGVYKFSTTALLNGGALTLDAGNDPSAVFIFQIGSTLTVANSSVINLVNGADANNVFFQVGTSATLGTSVDFAGNILAATNITVGLTSDNEGRYLVKNGTISLDTDAITNSAPEPQASGVSFLIEYSTAE